MEHPALAGRPAHLRALLVDSAQTSKRLDPRELPELVEGSGDEPDLFRLLPASPRRAFDLGVLSSDLGFHIFIEVPDDVDVLGPVVARARRRLEGRGAPPDMAYVHDFDQPSAPCPLLLPPGDAPELARGLAEVLSTLRAQIPVADADEHIRAARADLARKLKEKQRSALSELEALARRLGFGIRTVQGGVQTYPILHGKPVSAEQFEVLDESTRQHLTQAEEELSAVIEQTAERARASAGEIEEARRLLDEKVARALVEGAIAPLRARFEGVPAVRAWLARVADELVDSIQDFTSESREEDEGTDPEIATRLARFAVNVFVTQATTGADGAEVSPTPPVVHEDNPTFAQLFGFLERHVHLGALVSDYTRIRAGALHRASGGVLVLRAVDVLADGLAWNRLKRVLRARAVGHEDPIGPMGLYTSTLRPRPCPIDTKVVLVGNHDLYTQLLEADSDFASLFRVKVEIPADIDRTPANVRALDAHVLRIANKRGWGPFDRSARARVVDYASRLAEDGRKLSLAIGPIEEALAFATVIAHERASGETAEEDNDRPPPSIPPPPPRPGPGQPSPDDSPDPSQLPPVVIAQDVDLAWQERRERTAGTERRLREMVVSGEVILDTEGARAGVVNALAVLSAGDVQFGHPTRITAVVSLGTEGVIDVEREAALGGSVHTKGVAILRGFLSGTFGQERPIALRAQIAFEQSYGEVDGDSASSTELYAILSALAEVPVDQGIAVTGSVNQLGDVQVIGGVAAKIEGFYDLCAARGLNGRQGVMIPRSCVPHLVLRDDVAESIRAGRFCLWGIEKVTQGIEVLTGIPAGTRDAAGRYPADSVFGRVERRLIEIAERMRRAEGGEMPSNLPEGMDEDGG